jgi:hypothetical protein
MVPYLDLLLALQQPSNLHFVLFFTSLLFLTGPKGTLRLGTTRRFAMLYHSFSSGGKPIHIPIREFYEHLPLGHSRETLVSKIAVGDLI